MPFWLPPRYIGALTSCWELSILSMSMCLVDFEISVFSCLWGLAFPKQKNVKLESDQAAAQATVPLHLLPSHRYWQGRCWSLWVSNSLPNAREASLHPKETLVSTSCSPTLSVFCCLQDWATKPPHLHKHKKGTRTQNPYHAVVCLFMASVTPRINSLLPSDTSQCSSWTHIWDLSQNRNLWGTRKMTQRLRALTDHSENPGFSASTRMVANTVCNSISRETSALFSPLWALHTCGIYIHAGKHSYTGNKNNKSFLKRVFSSVFLTQEHKCDHTQLMSRVHTWKLTQKIIFKSAILPVCI